MAVFSFGFKENGAYRVRSISDFFVITPSAKFAKTTTT